MYVCVYIQYICIEHLAISGAYPNLARELYAHILYPSQKHGDGDLLFYQFMLAQDLQIQQRHHEE